MWFLTLCKADGNISFYMSDWEPEGAEQTDWCKLLILIQIRISVIGCSLKIQGLEADSNTHHKVENTGWVVGPMCEVVFTRLDDTCTGWQGDFEQPCDVQWGIFLPLSEEAQAHLPFCHTLQPDTAGHYYMFWLQTLHFPNISPVECVALWPASWHSHTSYRAASTEQDFGAKMAAM